MLDQYSCLDRDGLRVYCAADDRAFAEDTIKTLSEATAALCSYFEMDEAIPGIRAVLAPNRDTFDVLVADLLNVKIERPSDPRRIAQPQRTDMVFLSPSAYSTQSTYEYVPEDYRGMVYHELVHVVQEALSPGIENSPFWWDEGLAVYLSGQWQFTSQFRFREPVLEAIRDDKLPSLSNVEETPSLGYEFGWTLVRFIEQHRGKHEILRVVKRMKDGNIFSLLNGDRVTLETNWHAWLQAEADLRA